MEYEKKYKEALNKAKELMTTSVAFDRFTIERIFPELKESEDEKVRKKLIKFFETWNKTNSHCSGVSVNKILAWLEKQGEQKLQGKSSLEAIKDIKVEPKFHEGEWLCENEPNNYARFIQILEIVNVQGKERYRVSRDIHNDEDIVEFNFVEKYYHKFDVTDAKDGDVLYSPKGAGVEGIFLIKGWEQVECTGKTLCSSIGYRVEEDEIVVSEPGAIWWEGVIDPFYPATKEQRDLLFQKMKEEGYVWDAEKKELKKIEQTSAWSKEDENILRTIISDGIRGAEFDMLQIDWLKSIKNRYAWKPSDEQMKVLEAMLTVSPQSPTMTSTLIELYEDLNKLRGE